MRVLVILFGAVAVFAAGLRAQESRLRWSVVASSAVSARNPVKGDGPSATEIGEVFARLRPGSIELHATLPFLDRPPWGLEYSFGVIPLAWVAESLVHEYNEPDLRRTSFGVGLSPLILRAVAGSPTLAVEASVGGAVLRYLHRTPTSDASKTNFQGFLGAGLRVRIREIDLGVGYRRSHISNGGRAEFNPGIDSNDLYLTVWLN